MFYKKYYELQHKQIITLFSIIINYQIKIYNINYIKKYKNYKNNKTYNIINNTYPNKYTTNYNKTIYKNNKLL